MSPQSWDSNFLLSQMYWGLFSKSALTLLNLLSLNPAGIKAKTVQAIAGRPVFGKTVIPAISVVPTPVLPVVANTVLGPVVVPCVVAAPWGALTVTVLVLLLLLLEELLPPVAELVLPPTVAVC